MARVPISFYLNIIAGILVLLNHYASSETGDVALNKVTGAAGRFYTLFRDTAVTLQYSCNSHLEAALCGPTLDSILSRDVVEHLRVMYCPAPVQDSERVGGMSNGRQPHGGYGGSGLAFVHHKPPIIRSLQPPSTKDLLRQPPSSLDRSSQSPLFQAAWSRSSKAMAMIGLLLRTYASWWWFRAPFKVTGVLLVPYSGFLALGFLFEANMALRFVSQVYTIVVADFLQCIEWEAHRQLMDIGIMLLEQAHRTVEYTCKCT